MATQEYFLEQARKWKNIFLTWDAGTGKSYILQESIKECDPMDILITAPTWVAAINVGWATLHSTFWLQPWYNFCDPPKLSLSSVVDYYSKKILIIDEASMVRADMLDYINKWLQKKRKNQNPFWWLQVIFVWDLAQLPPILNSSEVHWLNYVEVYKSFYDSTFFTSSMVYKSMDIEEIKLTEIKRQTDEEFIAYLNQVRQWNPRPVIDYLNSNIRKTINLKWIFLCSKNNQVDDINNYFLKRNKNELKVFNGTYTWEFKPWDNITPEKLELKVDCRVMVTKNINLGDWSKLYNGDLCSVIEIKEKSVVIFSDRLQEEYEISFSIWEKYKYAWSSKECVWTFTQIPLRLWYAITVHKSQWLTLEKVNLNLQLFWSPSEKLSMLYVALSRLKTLAWISNTKHITI